MGAPSRPYKVKPGGARRRGAGHQSGQSARARRRDRGSGARGQNAAAQVILIDPNLLIYAIDANSPQHKPARPWLERVLSGTDPVGLPWIVILAFIRITTREGIMRQPLLLAAALAYVRSWLRQPCVGAVATGRASLADPLPSVWRRPARPAISRPIPTSRPWRWSAAPQSAPPITTLRASPAFGTSIHWPHEEGQARSLEEHARPN